MRLRSAVMGLTLASMALPASAIVSPTGRWGSPVGSYATICEDRSAAWAWEKDAADLRLVSSAGKRIGSWTLPQSIAAVETNDNCNEAWVISDDRRHIAIVSRDQPSGKIAAQAVAVDYAINRLYITPNGDGAIVMFALPPYVGFADRRGETLEVVHTPIIRKPLDYQPAFEHRSIWVIDSAGGLQLLERNQIIDYPALRGKPLQRIFASNGGHVGWAQLLDSGVYLVTDSGAVSGPFLFDKSIDGVSSGPSMTDTLHSGPWVWMRKYEGELYVMHVDATTNPPRVEPLNGGGPVADEKGNPIHVERIWPIGDGTAVWASEIVQDIAGDPKRVWRMALGAGGKVIATRVPAELHGGEAVWDIYPDSKATRQLWTRTTSSRLFHVDTLSKAPDPDAFPAFELSGVYRTDDPNRYWLTTRKGVQILHPANEFSTASVLLGKKKYVMSGSNTELAEFSANDPVTVDLGFPMKSGTHGHLTFRIVPSDVTGTRRNVEQIAFAEGDVIDGAGTMPIFLRHNPVPGTEYDLELTYAAGFGGLHIVWSKMRYVPSLRNDPRARAILIILVTLILPLVSPKNWPLRAWLPVVLPVVEIAFARTIPSLETSPMYLFIGAAAILALVAGIAVGWPDLLRAIAPFQPYRMCVPYVMRLRIVRRRIFAAYVTRMFKILEQRRGAEHYVPFDYTATLISQSGREERVIGAEKIAALLTAPLPQARWHVLIEAPGGRGKTALLHAILERALELFRENAGRPLPVLVEAHHDSILAAVEAGLEDDAVTAEETEHDLREGRILLIIDGLTEGAISASELRRNFAVGNGAVPVTICGTARPNDEIHRLFERTLGAAIVEPRPLSGGDAAIFIRNYLPSASEEEIQSLLHVARTNDDMHSPLLLRFGILAGPGKRGSFTELYDGTLGRLLRKGDEEDDAVADTRLECARDLAYGTYWIDQERVFRYERPSATDTATVRMLLQAGVLVSADPRQSVLLSHPQRVRFIHDSVQSYLTAKKLAATGSWSALVRAAGDPQFVAAQSELQGFQVSEVFHMCLRLFSSGQLASHLREMLLQWAERYGDDITVADVRGAIPEKLMGAIETRLRLPDPSAARYLRRVVEVSTEEPFEVDDIAAVFAVFAEKLWPALKAELSRSETAAESAA